MEAPNCFSDCSQNKQTERAIKASTFHIQIEPLGEDLVPSESRITGREMGVTDPGHGRLQACGEGLTISELRVTGKSLNPSDTPSSV